MSLAVISSEAAPVCPLPSTAESDSQLLAERASPRASQVGYLALVSESTTPYKSSEGLDAMRTIDRERHQREQILHGVIDSLTRIIAGMRNTPVATSHPSPSHIVRLPTRCIISTSAVSTAAIAATVLIKIS